MRHVPWRALRTSARCGYWDSSPMAQIEGGGAGIAPAPILSPESSVIRLVPLDRGRDRFEGLAGEAGDVEVAGVVEADEGPGVEAAALGTPAPVGDAGVEGVEEDAVAGGADAK